MMKPPARTCATRYAGFQFQIATASIIPKQLISNIHILTLCVATFIIFYFIQSTEPFYSSDSIRKFQQLISKNWNNESILISKNYSTEPSILISKNWNNEKDNFLHHTNEYGLKLKYLQRKEYGLKFRHPQQECFYLHFDNYMFENLLCNDGRSGFSRTLFKHGFGNALLQYWGGRAIAHWLKYDFQMNLCQSVSNYSKFSDKYTYFSSFLPMSINNSKHSNKYSMLYAQRELHETSWVHPSSLLFLFYNKYFGQIINNNYINAMEQYYKFNKLQYKMNEIKKQMHSSDIVIHIRCGDVFKYISMDLKRNPLPFYGFLTAKFIKFSVTNGTKTGFNINWIKSKISANSTVWIMSQLNGNQLRNRDKMYKYDCNYLINYMVNKSFSEFFKPATIKIIYDSNINDDFYRMINAPLLICSPSTFCLSAAIGNINGYSIIPQYGAYIDLNDITNIAKNYSDKYSNDMIAKQSKWLPVNHVIIDTLKAGWHVNEFKQFNYDIEILSEYIVTH